MKLRPYRLEDAKEMAALANNPKIAANLTNQFPSPYTIKDAKEFIEGALKNEPQRFFCIEVDGAIAGSIGIHPQNDIYVKNAELGYWLAEEYWGKGIMTQAVVEMTKYGFVSFDLVRIYAIPFGDNIGSHKVLEKAGFKLETRIEKNLFKNGKLQDECIYSIRN